MDRGLRDSCLKSTPKIYGQNAFAWAELPNLAPLRCPNLMPPQSYEPQTMTTHQTFDETLTDTCLAKTNQIAAKNDGCLNARGTPGVHGPHAADEIQSAYDAMRLRQAGIHQRAVTPFDDKISAIVFRAAELARNDVVNGDQDITFRVASAATGSGKTVSALAYMATAFESDPKFSAAYIVTTIRQADEIAVDLATLIGSENICVWTSAHDEGFKGDGKDIELGSAYVT